MKILQVCDRYVPYFGGVQVHVSNISERLAREYDVTVYTTDPSGKLPKEEVINGVLVRRFKGFSPGEAYQFSFGLWKELRNARFDIVHGHNYHAFPLFFSRYAGKERFIVTPHYCRKGATKTRDILIKLYRPFGRRIFQEADRVIAVSNYEKGLLMEDFNIDDGKIVVLPNGVNLKEFQGLEKKKGKHDTILYVGRLEKYKGVQYVIEALPLLGENVRLEIVGKGPYRDKLKGLAERLAVADRVNWYQDLDEGELFARYASADLFVQLSKYEAFGMAVAEALAAKTPCIVANSEALKEWVDSKNCFGIDYPVVVDRLAGLITEVIGTEVGEVKLWDWEQVVAELVKLYEE